MEVAIITVGDELLAGDTENTNGTWLARQITERGGVVQRILALRDHPDVIARYVEAWRDEFDTVVVTGGLGGTHDDVTMAAVAGALDRDLAVDPEIRADVAETSEAFVESNPDLAEQYDLELDVDAWSETVAGGKPLENPAGLSPGCVVENVYVLPGVPSELRATFETIADDFGGGVVSETLYTPAPEGGLTDHLETMMAEFDVAVGSYPGETGGSNRVKITGADPDEVQAAARWLASRIETTEE